MHGPGTYVPTRGKKETALDLYLRVLKYVLPTDGRLLSSHLWHNDLHAENIFVHREKRTEIVAIIDWQSTEVRPLFDHVAQPAFLDYDGPPLEGVERPKLPDNYQHLELPERQQARELQKDMALVYAFRNWVRGLNKSLRSYRIQ